MVAAPVSAPANATLPALLLLRFGILLECNRGPRVDIDARRHGAESTSTEGARIGGSSNAVAMAARITPEATTLARTVAPWATWVSITFAALVGILVGLAQTDPHNCTAAAAVLTASCCLAFLYQLLVRPFLVPLHNGLALACDGSFVVVAALVTARVVGSDFLAKSAAAAAAGEEVITVTAGVRSLADRDRLDALGLAANIVLTIGLLQRLVGVLASLWARQAVARAGGRVIPRHEFMRDVDSRLATFMSCDIEEFWV
jgi:hypothetical protein